MYELVKQLPSPLPAKILGTLGVRYVLLHRDKLSSQQVSRWDSQVVEASLTKPVKQFGETIIYELPAANCLTGIGSLRMHFQVPDIVEMRRSVPFVISTTADGRCWAEPNDAGERLITVEWQKEGTAEKMTVSSRAPWPVWLRANSRRQVRQSVRAPRVPGSYWFRLLKLGSKDMNFPAQKVILRRWDPTLATSQNSPSGLSAEYELRSFSQTLKTGDKAQVELLVRNIGSSIWIPEASHGFVRLGYLWYSAGGEDVKGGTVYLPYSIYPGMSYTFQSELGAPCEPGQYTLFLDLVSELVTWFHDKGVKPLRVPVTVLP